MVTARQLKAPLNAQFKTVRVLVIGLAVLAWAAVQPASAGPVEDLFGGAAQRLLNDTLQKVTNPGPTTPAPAPASTSSPQPVPPSVSPPVSPSVSPTVPSVTVAPVENPVLAPDADIVSIYSGGYHTLILLRDGRVYGLGSNNSGQLGVQVGPNVRRQGILVVRPLHIPLPGRAIQIAAAENISFALMEDGSVLAWGHAGSELGIGRAGMHLQIRENMPGTQTPQKVVGISDAVQLVANHDHAAVVLRDGTVKIWGEAKSFFPPHMMEAAMADSGRRVADVVAIPLTVPGLSDVVQLSMASNHALALRKDGRVLSWGSGAGIKLGQGPGADGRQPTEVSGLSDVMQVAANNFVSAVLKKDGTVWTWGSNESGQLAIAATDGMPDDTVRWDTPRKLAGVQGVVDLQIGQTGRFTMVRLKDATLRAWGNTDWGQIGAGVSATYQPTIQKTKIASVKNLWVTNNNAVAQLNDGSIWWWGASMDGLGPLGKHQSTPIRLAW